MQTITTEQLKSLQASDREFLLVNTLDAEHFQETKIAESVNVPQSQPDFAAQVAQKTISKEQPVVVYCASDQCDSSTQAAAKLDAAGFRNVYDYEGGAKAWQAAGEHVGA